MNKSFFIMKNKKNSTAMVALFLAIFALILWSISNFATKTEVVQEGGKMVVKKTISFSKS